MARDPELKIRVDADPSGAVAGLSKAQASVVGFSAAAGTALANYADQAIRGVLNATQEMIDQASLLQQSTGAVASVFGDYAGQVEASASRAATAVGLSANAYQELATIIGSQLKNAGAPMEEIAARTDDLIGLGSDLAATYGGSVADAVSAVSSLMRGERDPIERYGVTINQAAIDAYKAANGLDGLTGSAKTAADQQAALAILFQQTSDAQGAFARESDTLAGSQAILNASWQDAQAALGEALLPVLTIAAQLLSQFAQWVKENSTLVQVLAGVFIALAIAVWAANAAFLANPITWIIVAIGLLIAIIVLLIANWDSVVKAFETGAKFIEDIFDHVGTWIADRWQEMIDAITGAWEGFISWINGTIDSLIGWIRDAIDWFGNLFNSAQRANDETSRASTSGVSASSRVVSSTFGVSASVPVATSAAARQLSAGAARSSADSGTTIINVSGALDPNAVAKQISRLLGHRNARIGITAAAGVRG